MQSDVQYKVEDKTSWRIYQCQCTPLVRRKHERCCLQSLSCRPSPPEATAAHLLDLWRIFWQRSYITSLAPPRKALTTHSSCAELKRLLLSTLGLGFPCPASNPDVPFPLPPCMLMPCTFLDELTRFSPCLHVTHFIDSSLQNNFEDRQLCRHYVVLLVCLDICHILFLDVWWPMGACFKSDRQTCYCSGFSCRDRGGTEQTESTNLGDHHRRLFQENSISRLINTLIHVFFAFISTACHRKIEMEEI